MLDLKRIRLETDAVKEQLLKRDDPSLSATIDNVVAHDEERRQTIQNVEQLKARRNAASKAIAEKKKTGGDAAGLIQEMKEVSDRISQYDTRLSVCESEIEELLLGIPNTPLPPVPGGDESANLEVRAWGEPVEAADWHKPHWDLGTELGILDLERGARISGSGFPVYIGMGARLQRALINFMLDVHREDHGYLEVQPPYLVRGEAMMGTGQLPKLADDAYRVEGDDLWLIPTAEVPLTNLHGGEVLGPNEMPRHYVAVAKLEPQAVTHGVFSAYTNSTKSSSCAWSGRKNRWARSSSSRDRPRASCSDSGWPTVSCCSPLATSHSPVR